MSEPTLKFVYNTNTVDTNPYTFFGSNPLWNEIEAGVDTVIFTGGGIDDAGLNMGDATLSAGVRSPTIRPAVTSYVIPYVYVESGGTMYYVPLAGQNTNRYVFGVSISGTIEGDLYLEAWDDNSFSTYDLPVLSGTSGSSNESYVNAIRTTNQSPSPTWDGNDTGADFLRGQSDRVGLGEPPVTDLTNEVVFYNIYIRLETDASTFHNTPVLAFRYLYT